jgi:hypothetical protein
MNKRGDIDDLGNVLEQVTRYGSRPLSAKGGFSNLSVA